MLEDVVGRVEVLIASTAPVKDAFGKADALLILSSMFLGSRVTLTEDDVSMLSFGLLLGHRMLRRSCPISDDDKAAPIGGR